MRSVYQIENNYVLTPYLGYQRSENKSFIDWGWDLGFTGEIKSMFLGDYRTNIYLTSEFDLYPQRENLANQVDFKINKQFSSYASDSLKISYVRSKQQYYSSDSETIVDLSMESRNLHNVLNYRLASSSFIQINTILSSRNITDNTPVNPNVRKVFRFENRFGYRYLTSSFFFYLGLNTFQESQNNWDIDTDSKALQTGITTDFSYYVSSSDRLDLQLNFIKYQYDTPDKEENDDRDEIRFFGWAGYLHRFSPLLWIDLNAYVYLYHKMYLYKEQSANNNWNRIYRIQSAVNYQYNKWRNTLRTQVLANYTAYDFDHLFTNTRSFIFRQYSVSDSLLVPLFYRSFAGFYVRLELKDQGAFFKESFAQNILESAQIIYYDLFLKREGIFRLNFEAGFAFYHRKNWRHIPIAVKTRDISRVSPYLRIVYPLGTNLRFLSQISQNYLVDTGREKSEYTYGKLDLYYHF